ncbi:Glucosidase 2 subunit beta [Globisporangium polare]
MHCRGRAVRAALLLSCAALVALAWASTAAAAVASAGTGGVRGVAPEEQQRYASGAFECVVRGKKTALGLEFVNDDYCDCDNGEDEPGTSACSHLLSSVFYCGNDGYFPKKIPTSRMNDGICDCCDGSDEFVDASLCSNTCATEAVTFREVAKERLAVVEAGFKKRQAVIEGEVKRFFDDATQAASSTAQALLALEQLKARVNVHKDREERKEQRMRLNKAREAQAQADAAASSGSDDQQQAGNNAIEDKSVCVPDEATDKTCDDSSDDDETNTRPEADGEFEELKAGELVETEDENEQDEDIKSSSETAQSVLSADEETESLRVTSQVELSDGTRVSLAEYLRLARHSKPTKKLKGSRKSAEQMRREDFLGPLFNGDAQGRKRIGLYALRTLGVLCSPVRGAVELVLFIPRTLWDLLPSPSTAFHVSVIQAPWFRRLGGGQVYRGYQHVAWSAQVAWDAPVFVYNYLFPRLDESVVSSEAESLRRVVREIDEDIKKLEGEREEKRKATATDFGPQRAFFALQDVCIEKKIEKYNYKLCAFKEVKQDYTLLGSWDKWGVHEGDKLDYGRMLFHKGHKCWNGPERSVVVKLECGQENEIVSVDEPSTCEYVMMVRSPLACTREELTRAQQDFAFWNKP